MNPSPQPPDATSTTRPRLVGINHVALEVGDLEAALEFYGAIFELRGVDREPGMAFIDMGDQFIALSQGRAQAPRRCAALRAGRRRQGGGPSRPRGARSGDPSRPAARLPRPMGQPDPGSRLPRHPVHEGSAGDPRNGTGAPTQTRHRDRPAARQGTRLARPTRDWFSRSSPRCRQTSRGRRDGVGTDPRGRRSP